MDQKRRLREFGRTWWGGVWIKSLEQLGHSFSNRLPRGKSYARNKRVIYMEVAPGVVRAKVQGRRRIPYRVTIRLRKFTSKEWESLFRIIRGRPQIASRLLSLEIPQELVELTKGTSFSLLPQDTREFSLSCTCPDWALPCKHIAAVFYQISRAMDEDPFLLIMLRGKEREEFLDEVGIRVTPEEDKAYAPSSEEVSDFYSMKRPLNQLDLTLSVRGEGLVKKLLSPSPLFFSQGDFLEQLLLVYEAPPLSLHGKLPPGLMEILDRVDFTFDGSEILIVPHLGEITVKKVEELTSPLFPNRKRVSIWMPEHEELKERRREILAINLLDFCLRMDTLPLSFHAPDIFRFLLYLARFGRAILEYNNLAPAIAPTERGFKIVWEPFLADKKARDILAQLIEATPPFFMAAKSASMAQPANWTWQFLTHYLTQAMGYRIWSFMQKPPESLIFHPLIDTLLGFRSYPLQGPEDQSLYQNLKQWLEPLSLFQEKRRLRPAIKISPPKVKGSWRAELIFQAHDDPSLMLNAEEIWKGEGSEILSMSPEEARSEMLASICILNSLIPETGKFWVKGRLQGKVPVKERELGRFIREILEKSSLTNVTVISPPGLILPGEMKVRLKSSIKPKAAKSISYMSLPELLQFDWEIHVRDKPIPREDFLKLVSAKKRYLRLKEGWVILDSQEIEKLREISQAPPPLEKASAIEKMQAILLGEAKWRGERYSLKRPDEVREALLKIKREIPLPKKLNASLRPYQERGYRWMVSNLEMGFGCCIADDMGLGKTVQVIGVMLYFIEKGKGPILVVVPTTLLGNWQKELERFAPSINFHIYHGPERSWAESDVVLTSYGTLRQEVERFAAEWGMVVIDEAQNIKNPDAQQSRAVNALKAKRRIAMSGTPVENRLMELWSVMNFLNPGLLGPRERFQRTIALPAEKYGDRKALRDLRSLTLPFLLRRVKSDPLIMPELPDKLGRKEYCLLTPEQASLYQSVVEKAMEEIEQSEGMERRGLILKLLTSLKQICDHPSLYLHRGEPLSRLSGKAERLLFLLQSIKERREKVLIFSQYKQMGDLLVRLLEKEMGLIPLFLHGGLGRKERDRLVERFLEDSREWIFILSLRAGGTGLNLTPATNVIHYDLWWNPAVENQATDRAHRIGQEHRVLVHRFITRSTLEERIDEMLESKKDLAEAVVTVGEKWITEMSNKELRQLVELSKV